MSREKQDTTAFGFSLEEILKTVVDDDLRDVLGSELVELGDLRKQAPEIRKDSPLDSCALAFRDVWQRKLQVDLGVARETRNGEADDGSDDLPAKASERSRE